ncbi:MAG: hypothetical protein Q7R91_02120 [bacterium]|nr:hypothetical protein [bacterium]
MKKGLIFFGGAAAGFLLVTLAVELFFTDKLLKRGEDDVERRIAEWGVGS